MILYEFEINIYFLYLKKYFLGKKSVLSFLNGRIDQKLDSNCTSGAQNSYIFYITL